MAEPIVFLPGMMCDARLFAPQITALSRDHVIISAPITQGERIEEIASALLDQLPRRFALAGHAMGGMVAMEILRRAPERIARIALMDTSPLAETPQGAAAMEPLVIRARTGRLDEALREILRPDHLAPGPARAGAMASYMDMARDLGPDVFIRQLRALQRRRDQQPALRRCKVPALVLCGELDTLTPPKRHSFMAELIPYARFELIGGAGHLPTLEAPDLVLDALRDWLKQPFVLQ